MPYTYYFFSNTPSDYKAYGCVNTLTSSGNDKKQYHSVQWNAKTKVEFSDQDMSLIKNKVENGLCDSVYVYLNCTNIRLNYPSSKKIFFQKQRNDISSIGGRLDDDYALNINCFKDEYTINGNDYNFKIKMNKNNFIKNIDYCKYGLCFFGDKKYIKYGDEPIDLTNKERVDSRIILNNSSSVCIELNTTEVEKTYTYKANYTITKGTQTLDSDIYTIKSVDSKPKNTVNITSVKLNNVSGYAHQGWVYTDPNGIERFIGIGGLATLYNDETTFTSIWALDESVTYRFILFDSNELKTSSAYFCGNEQSTKQLNNYFAKVLYCNGNKFIPVSSATFS